MPAALPQTALTILALNPPTPHSRRLTTTLLPSSPSTLSASSSFSFSLANGTQELFVPRLAYRDLDVQDDGSLVATIDPAPCFAHQVAGETDVKMHVWKGEKLLGSWDVGRF